MINAIELDGMKKSEAAEVFQISRNTINLWLKRQTETGDCQAGSNRPHRTRIDTPQPKGVRILLSSSALTMKQSPISYQRSISPEAFCSITEASFDMPYRTIENKKECVLGVLVA